MRRDPDRGERQRPRETEINGDTPLRNKSQRRRSRETKTQTTDTDPPIQSPLESQNSEITDP